MPYTSHESSTLKGCHKYMAAWFIQIKRLHFTKITLKYFSIGERKYQIYKQGDGIMTESKYRGIHDILDSGTSQRNLMNFIFTIRWVYSQNILKFLNTSIYICAFYLIPFHLQESYDPTLQLWTKQRIQLR